jgi:hypothetical protein
MRAVVLTQKKRSRRVRGRDRVDRTVRRPQGDFIERLWQAKTVFAFSPDLALAGYVQYDSVSRNVGLNARLRWTVKPGDDVFLVWNRGWRSPTEGDGFRLAKEADQVVLKVRWNFRP